MKDLAAALIASKNVLERYRARLEDSLKRKDRVFVNVRKEDLEILLILARVGHRAMVTPILKSDT
jgi:hypothetical protein